jgi:hypothetical protein
MSTRQINPPAFYSGIILQSVTFSPPPEPQVPFDHMPLQVGRNGFQSYRQEPTLESQVHDSRIGMHFMKQALAKIEWAAHSGEHQRSTDLDLGPVGVLKNLVCIHSYHRHTDGSLHVSYTAEYLVRVPV